MSNTGPLISLEKLAQGYTFIRRLYDKVIIAPAVLEEATVGQFATPSQYLQHYRISDLIEVRKVSQPRVLPEAERLHEGETQAIQLALELQLPLHITTQPTERKDMTRHVQRLAWVLSAVGLLIFLLLVVRLVHAGTLPTTGQTISYPADKNDGVPTAVPVPDDGTLRRGISLQHKDNGDGTVTDLLTGLMWEKKCASCSSLHDVKVMLPWAGTGSNDTIWDWLEKLNTEGGKGFAGYHDWRIPNVRELQSLLDYGRMMPSIDPVFGPTAGDFHWSSTTGAGNPPRGWSVDFGYSGVHGEYKSESLYIRAVRDGLRE